MRVPSFSASGGEIFLSIFMQINLRIKKNQRYLHHQTTTHGCCSVKRGVSSAGSEHLPYKQGVTGSNPVRPTFIIKHLHEEIR